MGAPEKCTCGVQSGGSLASPPPQRSLPPGSHFSAAWHQESRGAGPTLGTKGSVLGHALKCPRRGVPVPSLGPRDTAGTRDRCPRPCAATRRAQERFTNAKGAVCFALKATRDIPQVWGRPSHAGSVPAWCKSPTPRNGKGDGGEITPQPDTRWKLGAVAAPGEHRSQRGSSSNT